MITGSDHPGFTPAQAEAAALLARHGRMAVVPDAAYLVPLEAPTTTSTLIREFWAQHAAGPSVPQPTRSSTRSSSEAPTHAVTFLMTAARPADGSPRSSGLSARQVLKNLAGDYGRILRSVESDR